MDGGDFDLLPFPGMPGQPELMEMGAGERLSIVDERGEKVDGLTDDRWDTGWCVGQAGWTGEFYSMIHIPNQPTAALAAEAWNNMVKKRQ